jgi:hypothetical protein
MIMKNKLLLLLSLSTVIVTGVGLSSCKDDDEPFVKPQLSFEKATQTVNEADGTIEVKVILDKAYSEDISIEFELSGSAQDEETATSSTPAADYRIESDHDEIEIKAGETEGIIEILIGSDTRLEDADVNTDPFDPETIEIKITDVDNENIEITRDDETEVLIEQEDGLIVFLGWDSPDNTDPNNIKQADMDLLVRAGANTTTWEGILTGSAQTSYQSPEIAFIPSASQYAAYGFSYVYYDGTYDPLDFGVSFIDFKDGALEDESGVESFEASYTAANKNKWTNETIATTQVVQTLEKSGTTFGSPSENISVPTTGSRIGSSEKFAFSWVKREPPHDLNAILRRLRVK